MKQNIDFLGIVQLLKALRSLGFSELELRKIASRIAVKLGADITIFPWFFSVLVIAIFKKLW